VPGSVGAALGATLGALTDLVLPSDCAGCGSAALGTTGGICPDCTAELARLVPYETAPTPTPYGLPVCIALGPYGGVLRELVLAYKDRGRHRLARPLAVQLARGVAAGAVRLGHPPGSPVVVIPVPSTAAAARQRHGDHMRRLARETVRTLNGLGWPAAMSSVAAARPRADSAHLSAADRVAAARDAFQTRSAPARRVAAAAAVGACVIVVDDVVTTGATLASLATRLTSDGVAVRGAVTLAATRRRTA
jgi:predicted amidophosphoribosyltransferase